LVPRTLAPRLHELLRRHFAQDPSIEVIVERRGDERRQPVARRSIQISSAQERRRIRNQDGRRIAERRAVLLSATTLEPAPRQLPRRARAHAAELRFMERLEPSGQKLEDQDTARLITRIQAGDKDAFALLYNRYFDRVYTYLRVTLRNSHEAEDATQQTFLQLLQALERYEHRGSFWSWLATIMRNRALNDLRQQGRLELEDSPSLDRRRERADQAEDADPAALGWIGDRDLILLVERLPLAQRQVLLLRYLLDLSNREIAAVLDRTPSDVSLLHHRALGFIRDRLAALGRTHSGRPVQWRRRRGKAPVLRARRFALLP
jgi:RNA polymerase sigma-70 factor (ECF subfamily)